MNILVVDGAGYIGGAITDMLKTTNHRVRVYDSLLYEESYRKLVEFIYGDIRDYECLRTQLDWADAVIWLAALVGDGACAINPQLSMEINQNTVKWLCENYDGRIIFTSTCSLYGAQDGILTEKSATKPLSVYANTKLSAEEYLTEKNAIITKTDMEFQDTRNYRVSSDKIRSQLGWKPIYSIDDGIIEIKELLETRRLKDISNPRYANQAFLTQRIPELQQA